MFYLFAEFEVNRDVSVESYMKGKIMLNVKEQLPIMLISWLSFSKDSHVLLIGNTSAYTEYLCEQGCIVECAGIEEDLTKYKARFDYVFANNIFEAAKNPEELFRKLIAVIKVDGVLYIGADNRLGLRYICGERDPYTERLFDGIENYKYAQQKEIVGRCYSRSELVNFISKNEAVSIKLYSVFPNLEAAQLIFSDEYEPNEEISIRYTPLYRNPDFVLIR